MSSQITRETRDHRRDYRPRFDLCPRNHASCAYPIPSCWIINVGFNPQTPLHYRSASVVGKSELVMMISRPGYAHEVLRLEPTFAPQGESDAKNLLTSSILTVNRDAFRRYQWNCGSWTELFGTSDRFITLRRATADVWTRIGRYQLTVQSLSPCTSGILTCKRHSTPTPSLTSGIDKVLREQVPGRPLLCYIYGVHRKVDTRKSIDHPCQLAASGPVDFNEA